MEHPLELSTVESFREEVGRSTVPTLVMFTTSWCPFCRRFKPKFLDAVAKNPDVRSAMVYIDDYDNPLWDEYSVEVVPTLAVFRSGRAVFRRDGVLGAGLREADLDAVVAYTRSALGESGFGVPTRG